MYYNFTYDSLTLLWFKMNVTKKITIQASWMKIRKISGGKFALLFRWNYTLWWRHNGIWLGFNPNYNFLSRIYFKLG